MSLISARRKNGVKPPMQDKILYFVSGSILVLFTLLVLYPILYVVSSSFSSGLAISTGRVRLFPVDFSLDGYKAVLDHKNIGTGYRNTFIYTTSGTLLSVAITMVAAYPMSRRDMQWKSFYMILFTITMFFSGGLIPTYILMQNLNLINSRWAMILPGTVSAYNVFIFRTFFRQIPASLSESAYLDGASEFKVLWQIIVPLSKPLLATFALFAIVGVWNSWFNALLYLNDEAKYPLQFVLRNYLFELDNTQLQHRAGVVGTVNPLQMRRIDPKGVRMAMIVVTMFPIMAVYPYFQKFFMKGVMIGAIKG